MEIECLLILGRAKRVVLSTFFQTNGSINQENDHKIVILQSPSFYKELRPGEVLSSLSRPVDLSKCGCKSLHYYNDGGCRG